MKLKMWRCEGHSLLYRAFFSMDPKQNKVNSHPLMWMDVAPRALDKERHNAFPVKDETTPRLVLLLQKQLVPRYFPSSQALTETFRCVEQRPC